MELSMEAHNCWEFRQCGLQSGGSNVGKRGICPAAGLSEWHGVNRGHSAGRFCWSVASTLCQPTPSGALAQKVQNCFACDFFKQVQFEEGADFALTLKDARDQLGKPTVGRRGARGIYRRHRKTEEAPTCFAILPTMNYLTAMSAVVPIVAYCKYCRSEYGYVAKRIAIGAARVYLGEDGAKRRTKEVAATRLKRLAAKVEPTDLVPCPKCGRVPSRAVREYWVSALQVVVGLHLFACIAFSIVAWSVGAWFELTPRTLKTMYLVYAVIAGGISLMCLIGMIRGNPNRNSATDRARLARESPALPLSKFRKCGEHQVVQTEAISGIPTV